MTEPKTTEDWQHAAERWEAAHGEMAAAAGRWQTTAEEWRRAFLTASDSSSRLGAELVVAKADLQRAWDDAEHQRQRADHNDRVATFASRQRDLMLNLLTPEQHVTLNRMMTEDAVR